MLFNEMPFPSHQGLPFLSDPPRVDGYLEPEPGIVPPPGPNNTRLEAGYAGGGRFTFGGEGGIPRAVCQCIKHRTNDELFMAFSARHDPSFDQADFVTIVLRPSFAAAPSAADRRIDVFPVEQGGAAANPPDPFDHAGSLPLVRTEKDPFTPAFYERNPGGSPKWSLVAAPPGFAIKVRSVDSGSLSWGVEVKIPTDSAWLALQPEFGLFFDIGQVFFDGIDTNVVQFAWPFDSDAPLANVLADPVNTVRANWDPVTMGKGFLLGPGDPNPAKGVRFKQDYAGIGVLSGGAITATLDMAVGASNDLVARLQNTSGATAEDVRARFRIAEFGISGGLYGSNPALLALWEEVPEHAPSSNPSPAGGLDIPPTPLPSSFTDIVFNWTVTQADHDKFHPPMQPALWDDQCIWVQLDSVAPGGAGVPFAQESVRRNLRLVNLSDAKHPAVVNGAMFGEPLMDHGRHELLLHVTKTLIPPTRPGPTPLDVLYRRGQGGEVELLDDNPLTNGEAGVEDKAPTATWHTIVHAYQRTQQTLTDDDKTVRRIVVHAGSYAYVARHELQSGEEHGSLDIVHELVPDGDVEFKALGNDFYLLTIAPDERVVLVNELRTVPRRDRPEDGGGSGYGKGGEGGGDEPTGYGSS